VRCGASLIQPIKEEESKEVAHIPEATQVKTRETTPMVGTHKESPTSRPEGLITGSRLARPSTVQPELSPQRTSETVTPPIVTPRPIEEDITNTKHILVDQAAPALILAPKAEPRMEPRGGEVELSPKPPPRTMPVLQTRKPIAEVAPPPVAPEPVIEAATIVQIQEVENNTESPIAMIHDPEYRNDSKLGPMLLDHKIIHNELKQIESELDSVRLHQDAEVQRYRDAAEAKKIHYESLKEQLSQAKQELIDAGKKYYESEDCRKKEVVSREKQFKNLLRSISKSEAAIDKRIREIDSKKSKRA